MILQNAMIITKNASSSGAGNNNFGQYSRQEDTPLLLMPSDSLFESVEKEAIFSGMKDNVISAIRYREILLAHLRDSIYSMHQKSLSGILDSLIALHEISLSVVESIIELDSMPRGTAIDVSGEKCMTTFLWEGKNYLLKMLSDAKFLCKAQLVLDLISPKTNLRRNPFLVPHTVDEIIIHNRQDERNPSQSSRIRKIRIDIEKVPWKVDLVRLERASERIIFEERRTKYGYGDEKNIVHVVPVDHKHAKNIVELRLPPPPALKMSEVEDVLLSPKLSFDDALIICVLKLLFGEEVDASIGREEISRQTVYRIARGHFEDIVAIFEGLGSRDRRHAIFVDRFLLVAIQSTILRYLDKAELQKSHQNETMSELMKWLLEILTLRSQEEYSHDDRGLAKKSMVKKSDKGQIHFQNDMRVSKELCAVAEEHVLHESEETVEETKDDDSAETTLVPVPLWCAVSASEGSKDMRIEVGEVTRQLCPGDKVRICHPYLSLDYTIAPDMSNFLNKGVFSTIEEYDHTPLLTSEFIVEEDSSSRLHDPQAKYKESMKDRSNEKIFIPCTRATILDLASQREFDVITHENIDDRSPLSFRQMRLWKLVPNELDKRLEWRREYDNGLVQWRDMYSNSSHIGEHFRVKWQLNKIERDCFDPISDPKTCIHEHRLQYFEQVPLVEIISETFRTVCNHWHPVSSSIDIFKWAKLARSMKFLSRVKNANHEVDMAFFRHSHKRKLDLSQFHAVLIDMASIKYPSIRYDPQVSFIIPSFYNTTFLPFLSVLHPC